MKISKFNESVNVTPKKKSNFDYDEWENTVGKSSRIAAYRKYAGIAEDFEISESNIDEYALNRVSSEFVCDRDRVKAEILGKAWED